MATHAIIPPEMQTACSVLKLSAGIVSGKHMFLTGATGSGPDGKMSSDFETQIRSAFDKIEKVLRYGGLNFGAVVEMTSYHIGIHDHFDVFTKVREQYVKEPYPAWTAVEVAGLRREGAIVEIRVIASLETAS